MSAALAGRDYCVLSFQTDVSAQTLISVGMYHVLGVPHSQVSIITQNTSLLSLSPSLSFSILPQECLTVVNLV